VNILPLYAAPQYADRVIDWIWRAFGDGCRVSFSTALSITARRQAHCR